MGGGRGKGWVRKPLKISNPMNAKIGGGVKEVAIKKKKGGGKSENLGW